MAAALGWGEIARVAVTLFLIMDPVGNVPTFNLVLRDHPPRARMLVIAREMTFALGILLAFLYAGETILDVVGVTQPSLGIAGGILLFLIAMRMLYPEGDAHLPAVDEDPFIVPLAMPLVAGPSTIAVLILIGSSRPDRMGDWTLALLLAWGAATAILALSPFVVKVLGHRGRRALERLMGMLLVLLAVQMFLDGLGSYVERLGGS